MASVEASHNGHAETNGNGELTAAQKLMMQHEAHNPTVEEVPDEEDLKHGEQPQSSSILESVDANDVSAPGWVAPMSAKAAGKQKAQEAGKGKASLDTQSMDNFPALGGPRPQATPKVAPSWGSKISATATSGAPNGKANGTNGTSTPNSSVSAPAISQKPLALPGQNNKEFSLLPSQMLPKTQFKKPLAELLKDINRKSKANVTMKQMENGQMRFTSTGPGDSSQKALRDIVSAVGAKITKQVPIPREARSHIIGRGGATIKGLQERTGARIQMPKQEDNGDDDMVNVTIEGDAFVVDNAAKEVVKIANERAPTVDTKLKNIPAEFYPFLESNVNALETDGVQIRVPSYHKWTLQAPPDVPSEGRAPDFRPAADDNPIILAGDRLAVQKVREQIEEEVEKLKQQLTLQRFNINHGEHQFIVGNRGISAQQFHSQTGCAIILPSDEENDDITVVGPPDQIENAIQQAMQLAAEMQSTHVDISKQHRNAPGGAGVHAFNVTRYLRARKAIEQLEKLHNTHIVTPVSQGVASSWELYSRDRQSTMRAQQDITSIVNCHPPSRFAQVPVDPFFHAHLRKEVTPRVQADYGVHVVIPESTAADVPILLVFEGPEGSEPEYKVPSTRPTEEQVRAFKRGLEDARQHILDIINAQEELSERSINVPMIFHEKLRKFILKEQQARPADQIPIRVWPRGTEITLKGPRSAVDTLGAKIEEFVRQAIEDEKERGFTMSFDFPQKHANQLIGKGGSNISNLRERFDVDIQVNDGKVELKGPKAKAEAAKSHISALGRQWADETTHILKVDPQFHRDIIGAKGATINKLQDRHKVQIHFPQSARPIRDDQSSADAASEAGGRKNARRDQQPDEVMVKGPKKGADEARDEILSVYQYLKDNSYTATVIVQQSQVASLVGKGGKAMDELRLATKADIRVANSKDNQDPSGQVPITIKGTKAAVDQAKKLLEEKKSVFDDTITRELEVDKKYHRFLIGPGGKLSRSCELSEILTCDRSIMRDIVNKAGGDPARTVQFPKADKDNNVITVEGKKAVVEQVITAFKAIINQKESQTTETVEVPTDKHRSLIGRGGETKKDLEAKFNVSLDIPRQGSNQTGIKIVGQPADVENAVAHILDMVKEEEGETVMVPRKVHHGVADNGYFFRTLRNQHQVKVDHAGAKVPPKPQAPAARNTGSSMPLITDEQDSNTHSWNVVTDASDLDGEIPWVLRGSPENVATAKTLLNSAIQKELKMTTTGFLILPDPRTWGYVIGPRGAKVSSIREATGCKVEVPKDPSHGEVITIQGTKDGVEKAKNLILKAVEEGNASGGRS